MHGRLIGFQTLNHRRKHPLACFGDSKPPIREEGCSYYFGHRDIQGEGRYEKGPREGKKEKRKSFLKLLQMKTTLLVERKENTESRGPGVG